MYKIGYILDDGYNTDIERTKIIDMFNIIKNTANKFNLNIEFKLIDDYTKEACDLIIYEIWGVDQTKMYWHYHFMTAKGNPKWLFFDIGEPHSFGMQQFVNSNNSNERGCNWGDDRLLRTLCYYKHPVNGYSITNYETTPNNFQFPCCLKWFHYQMMEDLIRTGELEKQRNIKKKFFCSMVLSDTTPERYNFFNYMTNNYKYIWSYGKTRNNTGNRFYTNERLYKLMPKFKFNICFENTRSDFNECYVTEKIFNAFKWGTVPIYWGENNYIYNFLNKKSFINLTGLSLKESLEIIKEYDNDDKLYYDMLYANPINESYNLTVLQKKYELFIVKMLTDE